MRTAITSLALLALACSRPDAPTTKTRAQAADAETEARSDQAPEAAAPEAKAPALTAQIVRKDLLAQDLPPVPSLGSLALTATHEGELALADGSDELAPRAAVALREGLLLAGQAYLDRQPGSPSQSWRWLGWVPNSGGESSSTKLEPGAIRAAVADGQGGALLAGTRGISYDARGWFGVVDGQGRLGLQIDLDSPNSTEMLDVIAGAGADELALVAGYVDAQGWVVSLDPTGKQRWHKYIGSYGYTQIRGFARLEGERGDLLAIGTRAQEWGESWWGRIPGDGGKDPGPDDVEQAQVEIEGADEHQMLRSLVDLGADGLIALGTAKKNYLQAHDQVLAVGFDRSGAVRWSKVIDELRVTEVFGGLAEGGRAHFVVGIPGSEPGKPAALGLLELSGAGASSSVQIAGSEGWMSAGFVEGSQVATLLSYSPSTSGMKWRQLPVAK